MIYFIKRKSGNILNEKYLCKAAKPIHLNYIRNGRKDGIAEKDNYLDIERVLIYYSKVVIDLEYDQMPSSIFHLNHVEKFKCDII